MPGPIHNIHLKLRSLAVASMNQWNDKITNVTYGPGRLRESNKKVAMRAHLTNIKTNRKKAEAQAASEHIKS